MIELSQTQRKTIAAGLTVLALSAVFAFVAFALWLFARFLSFASAALVPVLLGFFLSLFFKPYYQWWVRLVHNPTLALLLMLFSVVVPLGLVFWYAGSVMVEEVSNLVRQGPHLLHSVIVWFETTFPKLHALLVQLGVPYQDVGTIYTKFGTTALAAGSGILKYVGGIVSVLVSLIFFVFFLMTKERRGSEVVAQLSFLKPETRDFLGGQVDGFIMILVSFFQRQTVICLIEGLYYGLGFWFVGLPYGFLVGFLLGVLNLIPLFGSVVCLPLALPLAYFGHDGSLTRLMLALGVWLLGQGLDGYFITPKIQGDKTGLGYAGVIFSFFFWATVLGPVLGMLLAIPLSAFCVVLWRAISSKYIKPVV